MHKRHYLLVIDFIYEDNDRIHEHGLVRKWSSWMRLLFWHWGNRDF